MPAVALVGDSVSGVTSGEHGGHNDPPHPPLPISGSISGSAQSKMTLGGILVAVTGSGTAEVDGCDGGGSGATGTGSSKMTVQGKAVNRIGDPVNPHNGTVSISSGHSKMMVGG
jgi:uncharacterized Zn-binding protein involved in type VI secretion